MRHADILSQRAYVCSTFLEAFSVQFERLFTEKAHFIRAYACSLFVVHIQRYD